MPTCPDCQSPIDEHTTFCGNCGLRISPEPGEVFYPIDSSSTPPTPNLKAYSLESETTDGCPSCGEKSSAGDIFCLNCGFQLIADQALSPSEAQLSDTPQVETNMADKPARSSPLLTAKPCSACGFENIPGEMFCQNCGVQLAPVPSTPPPPPVQITPQEPVETSINGHSAEFIPIDSSSLFCPECGRGYTPDEHICPNCGTFFQTAESEAPADQEPPEPLDMLEHQPQSEIAGIPVPVFTGPCPSCGHNNTTSDPYCQNCGIELLPAEKTSISGYETLPLHESLDSERETPPEPGPVGMTGRLVHHLSQAVLTIPEGKSEIMLGRHDPEQGIYPDIDLTDFGGEAGGVSRLHARLFGFEEQVFIEDLQSTNYTYLNKQKLQPEQQYQLNTGDEIRLGKVVLTYYTS